MYGVTIALLVTVPSRNSVIFKKNSTRKNSSGFLHVFENSSWQFPNSWDQYLHCVNCHTPCIVFVFNVYIFLLQTSVFTPMEGSVTSVHVTSTDPATSVISLLLHKFKVWHNNITILIELTIQYYNNNLNICI